MTDKIKIVGLKSDALKREITKDEADACIYYLMNLDKVLKSKVTA